MSLKPSSLQSQTKMFYWPDVTSSISAYEKWLVETIGLILQLYLFKCKLIVQVVKIVWTKITNICYNMLLFTHIFTIPQFHCCTHCYTICAKWNFTKFNQSNKYKSAYAAILNNLCNPYLSKAGTEAFPAGWNVSIKLLSTQESLWCFDIYYKMYRIFKDIHTIEDTKGHPLWEEGNCSQDHTQNRKSE